MMNYLGGVSQGERYYQQLKTNGLIIHPTNGPTLQALTSGEIKLALVQSSAGIGAALGDKNLAVKYLNPVTLLPSALGIDAKAPAAERAEAEKFIDYVLSPAGQKVMQSGDPTGDSLYYPVLQSTSPLPALPSLADVKTQSINPYTWGPRRPRSTPGSTAPSSGEPVPQAAGKRAPRAQRALVTSTAATPTAPATAAPGGGRGLGRLLADPRVLPRGCSTRDRSGSRCTTSARPSPA